MGVWESSESAGIRHFACQGLDRWGNPEYSFANMTTTATPADLNKLERLEYYPASDTMYLTGYSASLPMPNGGAGLIGTTICRYDHWSTNPTLHPGFPVLPVNDMKAPIQVFPTTVSVAGSYLFVGYCKQNDIVAYNADTGAQAGHFKPGTSVGGSKTNWDGPLNNSNNNVPLGWTDIPYGMRAFERRNEEYDIFNEDDEFGKVVMYRWSPAHRNQKITVRHLHKRVIHHGAAGSWKLHQL
jgi:hypothetical protein